MKAWRKEAQQINARRALTRTINLELPRDKRLEVEPNARTQMRQRLNMQRMTKGLMVYSNWLLAGLFIRAGITKAP
jgi:hypothetical protein